MRKDAKAFPATHQHIASCDVPTFFSFVPTTSIETVRPFMP